MFRDSARHGRVKSGAAVAVPSRHDFVRSDPAKPGPASVDVHDQLPVYRRRECHRPQVDQPNRQERAEEAGHAEKQVFRAVQRQGLLVRGGVE